MSNVIKNEKVVKELEKCLRITTYIFEDLISDIKKESKETAISIDSNDLNITNNITQKCENCKYKNTYFKAADELIDNLKEEK